MKKILMYASVASMIKQFNMNNISILQSMGYKVDVACNFKDGNSIPKYEVEKFKSVLKEKNIEFYQIPIPRKLFDFKNMIRSYFITLNILQKNEYNIVHCHSPIGGAIVRLANKGSKNYKLTKMIYTAHGFHFFNGNNKMKNFIFKSIESYLSKFTDVIITINKEDYNAAKKFKLKPNGCVRYVPGIGINLDEIKNIERNKKKLCEMINIKDDSILMLSVGELNVNKNHKVIIKAMPFLPYNFHYLICGVGNLKEDYLELSEKLGVENRLHLLGFRSDVLEIMKSCDVFVFPSIREGLSVALMEAMACKLPCIVSNIRGNVDLIDENGGGLFEYDNVESFVNSIKRNEINKLQEIGAHNFHVIQSFDVKIINGKMKEIYRLL